MGKRCECPLVWCGFRFFLSGLSEEERRVLGEVFRGFLRAFVFFDRESEQWYMDGRKGALLGDRSLLARRLWGEKWREVKLDEGFGNQPLWPFFRLARG
jgi:hypothetical protein